MNREEAKDIIILLFYASVCICAITVLIIPALVFRLVQDELQ